MENPRPEKVAVVAEVTAKFDTADAVFVSEYRGLTVAQLAELRRALRDVGGEHKVYKNTLATRAARDVGKDVLVDLMVGPTGLTFVTGDVARAAKALRDFAKANPLLVLKGGVIGTAALSAKDIDALADLPPREVVLAQLAGALQAPLVKTANLFATLPRNFAYALAALRDQREAA
jgi:large subunit ribosomal protein L10